MRIGGIGGWLAIVLLFARGLWAQEIRNVTVGWGNAIRLGRWTPVFVTVEDAEPREIDLQIHGSYGEKGEALCVHQSAVAQPTPVTYELLYPINAQLSRIVVMVSDRKTGKTLSTQPLQRPSAFTPAGMVPKRLLAANEALIGISGNLDDAQGLEVQLGQGQVSAGILDPLHLPANFAGYDGVSVLVLAAPDWDVLKPEQEIAMLQWVGRGGNLLLIPPASAMPAEDALVSALPAAVGENHQVSSVGGIGTLKLNARRLTAREGAMAFLVLGETGYWKREGMGKIMVSPVDFSAVKFADEHAANGFWRAILAPMVKVPEIAEPTSLEVSDADEQIVSGPNAGQSVGRGRRESDAIRDLLVALGAGESVGRVDWRGLWLWLAGICLLLGPIDSILLMRLGQRPRNGVTIAGWAGLLISVSGYAAMRGMAEGCVVNRFRLVDQVDRTLVAASEIAAVNCSRPAVAALKTDEYGWWEPANQAARLLRADRFVDAEAREDKNGCRPEGISLTGEEAQAWHGEWAGLGRGWLAGGLRLERAADNSLHLRGRLLNHAAVAMEDFRIITTAGEFDVKQSLAAGASLEVDAAAGSGGIDFGLPADAGDISPERADVVEQLVKEGKAAVWCEVEDPEATEILRSVVPLGQR